VSVYVANDRDASCCHGLTPIFAGF